MSLKFWVLIACATQSGYWMCEMCTDVWDSVGLL